MERLVILLILCALSAGQIRVPSSYENGIKWEFDTNVFHGDVLARSNVDQVPAVPTVYKKELVMPIARREPVTAVYKKPFVVPDVYKKPVVPTVYKKELVVQNTRKQQLVIPPVSKVHSKYIYKSEPVVQNVYQQQAAVPIVHKMHPTVPNVYQFKSQPIQPVVHYQELPLLQNFVPRILPVISQNKMQHNAWNYQYNPHYAHVHEDVHVVPHN